MRLSTLVLGFLVLVAGAVALVAYRKATEERRAWRRLLALEGQDLRKNPEAWSLFSRALRKSGVDARGEASLTRSPWRVVRLGAFVVLLDADTIVDTPGAFWLRAHVFGEEGNHVSSADFSACWQIAVEDTRPFVKPEVPGPILEMRSRPTFGGGLKVARQYYAVIEGRLALLRLEDSAGRSVANVYERPNFTIGLPVPDRTGDQWEAALHSGGPAELLRSLVWIGGIHADPNEVPLANVSREPAIAAQLVDAVRQRPGVRVRIAELGESSNLWIRDAATVCVREK